MKRPTRFLTILGVGLLADALAAALGAAWRAFNWTWERYAGFWNGVCIALGVPPQRLRQGVVSIVTSWGGVLFDYGGAVYNIRHPNFGAVCNGTTNDQTALTAFIAAIIAANRPGLIPGPLRYTTTISDADGTLHLRFAGRGASTLYFDGAADDWAIDLESHRSELRGGFTLRAYTGGDDYTFNGIRCRDAASRVIIEDAVIYRMKNGLQFVTVYGCEFTGDVSECDEIGVDFDSGANANTVWAQQITGRATGGPGTTGVRNDGLGNIIKGQQLSEWATAYYGVAGSTGTMFGHFAESNTKTLELEAGAALAWDCPSGSDGRVVVAEGATLTTPWGRVHPAAGISHVPTTMLPFRSLAAYYPITTNSTTAIPDFSGNGRSATKFGTWASTTGPYGYAISLATGAYNSIRIPAAVLTYNAAWACAILVRSRTWGSGDVNRVLTVYQGSNTIAFNTQKDTTNVPVLRNGVSAGNLSVPLRSTDDWEWILVGFDGSTGVSCLHPSMIGATVGQSVTLSSNPLASAIDTIEIGASTNGTMEVGAIAFWQGRVPSKVEMLHWVSQTTPPVLASIIDPRTGVRTFANGDTSPSVLGGKVFKTANTGATTIAAFDDGYAEQEIHVIIGDANTTIDFTSTTLKGNAGADWSPTTNDHLTCVYDGTNWYCRISDNTA